MSARSKAEGLAKVGLGIEPYAAGMAAKRYGCFDFLPGQTAVGGHLACGAKPLSWTDTKCRLGGSVSTPFRGSVVMDVFPLNVNKVKTYICGCV